MGDLVRLGVIGAGAITRRHAAAIAAHPDQVAISAVFDTQPGAAKALAAEVPGARPFADLDQLLAAVDAAIVATPHFLHFEQAMRAVEAGVPVLAEKPLVTKLDDLRALRDASAKHGTPVVAGQMQRFDPVNAAARAWIDQDPSRFGDLESFTIRAWQDITEYTASIGLGHWLLDGRLAGGGVVVSLAVHQIDLLRFLGQADYASVTAVGAYAPPFHDGAEARAAVIITMANGAIGTLHADYNTPRGFQSESLAAFGSQGGFTRDFRDLGTYYGPLLYSPAHTKDVIDFSADGQAARLGLSLDLAADPFENQVLHFARVVQGEAAPINSIAENFNTVACIAAINDAILAPGTPVAVAQS